MTDGAGARRIGSWFGTGPDRGMALLFIAAGLIGLTITLLAFCSRGYGIAQEGIICGPGRPPKSPGAGPERLGQLSMQLLRQD